MKIRTQILLSMAALVIIFILLGASLAITSRQVADMEQQRELTEKVLLDAYRLEGLTNDFLLHHEKRATVQWWTQYASLSADLDSLAPAGPGTQAIIRNIRNDQQHLGEIFTKISAEVQAADEKGTVPDDTFVSTSWSRMMVENQGVIFGSSQLVDMIETETAKVQNTQALLIASLLGTILLILLVNYLLIYRRVLSSVIELHDGTAMLGKGDLNFRIPDDGDDEFCDLAVSFNTMAASRKQAEEALRQKTTDLESVNEELTSTEEELRANYEVLARSGRERETLIHELEQKNAELESFTYTVSHDLKSPIITILGYAGMLEDSLAMGKGDPDEMKSSLNRISLAARRMEELLMDLLQLSRVGRIISPPEKVSFGLIAREAVDLVAIPLQNRGVTVRIDEDMPIVTVDHQRIREVLVNLIENAVKYMGDQQDPDIHIGVTLKEGGPVFSIRDNGIGIKPAYLERIFNIFEKLDPSTPGTGVGLTIVKRIIEIHGGRIWAESEGIGKGTTMWFTLPDPSFTPCNGKKP